MATRSYGKCDHVSRAAKLLNPAAEGVRATDRTPSYIWVEINNTNALLHANPAKFIRFWNYYYTLSNICAASYHPG